MRIRRRIAIVGTASAAGGLALAFVPLADARSTPPKPPPGSTVVRCRESVTTQIPADSSQELPSASSGEQWGQIHCRSPIGVGVAKDAFTVRTANGKMLGKFRAYFPTGTVFGRFALVPDEGSLQSFTTANYSGRVRIVSGSGAWSGVAGKGTDTCQSPDGLHYQCVLKLALSKL
jgi:hypothetical protein